MNKKLRLVFSCQLVRTRRLGKNSIFGNARNHWTTSHLVHQDSISELAAAMCGEEPEQVYVIEKAGNIPQSSATIQPGNQLRLKCLIHQVFLHHFFCARRKLHLSPSSSHPSQAFLNMLCFCGMPRRVCACNCLSLSHLKPTQCPNVWSCLTLCQELIQNFMSVIWQLFFCDQGTQQKRMPSTTKTCCCGLPQTMRVPLKLPSTSNTLSSYTSSSFSWNLNMLFGNPSFSGCHWGDMGRLGEVGCTIFHPSAPHVWVWPWTQKWISANQCSKTTMKQLRILRFSIRYHYPLAKCVWSNHIDVELNGNS